MSDELDQRPPFKPARVRILGALKKERQLRKAAESFKRIIQLEDLLRSSRHGTAIDGFTTWRSRRLPGGGP